MHTPKHDICLLGCDYDAYPKRSNGMSYDITACLPQDKHEQDNKINMQARCQTIITEEQTRI